MYKKCAAVLALILVSCANQVPDTPASSPEPEPVKLDVKVSTTNVRFGDSDRTDWGGRKPWSYPVHGIDVSKFQQDIDWRVAWRSGVNFAFIKATEGGDHLDAKFHENWQAAKAAGVYRGAYHFYYFCRTAAEQADWYIRNVPYDPEALPPVLDMEWNHLSRTCPIRPAAQKIRSEMRIYLSRVAAHYGKPPIIYVTPDFYQDNELWKLRGYQFWLRAVAEHPSKVYAGQSWLFWQYTGTGLIPGIEGNVDINAFYGGVDAWRQWVAHVTTRPDEG